MNKWINDLKLDKSVHTVASYDNKIKKYLRYIEENIFNSVGQLESLELLEASNRDIYLEYLTILKDQGLSNQTINIYSAAIKSALNFYERNTSYVKSLKVEQKERKINVKCVLELLKTSDMRLKTLIRFMLETGIRASELNNSEIRGQKVVVYGKGAKERTLYISPKTKSLIDEFGLIKIDGQALYRLLKPFGIAPHMIRHVSATMWLEKGANIKMVQEHLGHLNIITTSKYLHVTKEQRANFVEGLL